MRTNGKFIVLFSCCIPVKGISRSLICDVQRNSIKFIPNALFELILDFKNFSVEDLLLSKGEDNKEIISEYFEFLINNELAFYSNKRDKKKFPLINLDFKLPQKISNAIIEIEIFDVDKVENIVSQLDNLHCSAIEIRLFSKIELHQIETLIKLFQGSVIKEIDLVLIDNNFSFGDLNYFFPIYQRLKRIIVGSSKTNKSYTDFFIPVSEIIFTNRQIHLPTCCGNFGQNQFYNNLTFISESQKYNTCLNGKVTIDKDGNIKNCPSSMTSFGNVNEVSIATVISNDLFVEKWTINKDQILVCQDCEFRYICMDCRAYLEDPQNIYSKPLKCGYNPYSCEWEDWTTNPLKTKIRSFYQMLDI